MEIKIKQLKKTVEVKASVKNLKKTYAAHLELAKLEDTEVDGPEALEKVMQIPEKMVDYIVDIMKLKEDSREKLEEMEMEEVTEIFSYVSSRLMGASDADIEKAKENNEQGLAQESE
ncbi:prophage pi1 protein 43 [Sphingobacterium faecium PCAi_F2.5]|nr:prophage pi1 protein 43 [Sphingobacterium faecium PCAi_F2.5]